MRFRILGPLRVWDGANWTPVHAAQQRLVLAILLIEAGRVVSTDRLIDEIWGEHPPRTAQVTVQGYVRRLRMLLGDGAHGVLRTRGRGYELVVTNGDLDAEVFERLVDTGTSGLAGGDLDTAVEQLSDALELWQGLALGDVPASPTVAAEAARLDQRRLAAQEDRLDALLDLGRHAAAVDELHRAVEAHPLRERLWAQLMLALHRCGRRAEALQTYRNAHRVMLSELGLEPGAELRRLEQAILTDDPRLTVAQPTPKAVPAQLPPDVAGFTGRETHLRRLETLLPAESDSRPPVLVISTLVGTAGVGKTALAVHWAHRVRDRFPDGQLYVNLRGYGPGPPLRPIDALAAFLPALGVPAKQVPVEEEAATGLYRSLLADQRVLVLLDNANHPDQIRPLLPGSPGCLVLLTSRDRLDGMIARDGAVRLALDVLAPAESLSLLAGLLGARRVRAEPEAAATLAGLCGHLPLALRIAAANLGAQPDGTIAGYAARLAAGDRLTALQVNGDPQAAVRAAFDYSYAALPADARRLFRLLGVIPGPDITPAAAAALTGVSPAPAARLLDRLASAHLIDEHTHGRYTLHDLLRLYATDQAAAEDSESDRQHALGRLYSHYLHNADAAAARLYPHVLRLPDTVPPPSTMDDNEAALAWLDAEWPNLVAAVTHAAARGPYSAAWQLADALVGYLYMRMYTVDWQVIAEAGLAAARADGNLRAQAATHLSLATLARGTGRNQQAIELYTHALELARQTGWLDGGGSALGNLGIVCWVTGRTEEAIANYTQALAIARRTGRISGQATSLRRLGLAYWGLGRLQQSAEHLNAALALQRKMDSRSGEARTVCGLGEALRALGRLDEACTAIQHGLALYREFGDRNRESDALRLLAAVHRDAGRHGEALELAASAVGLARETGNRPIEADALNTMGTICDSVGRHREAIKNHQVALGLARNAGNFYTETEALCGLAAAHHHAGDDDLATEHAATALAIARQAPFRLLEGDILTVQAAIHHSRGVPEAAVDHAEKAVALQTETGHRLGQARAHLVAAQALRDTGHDSEADAHHQRATALLSEIGVS